MWGLSLEVDSAKTRPLRFTSETRSSHPPQVAKISTELQSPHPHEFEASSSDTPATDLRGYLTRKRSIHQIAIQFHCEQLISALLSDCHYNSLMTKSSVFSRLSNSSSSKRQRFHKKKSFYDVEYLEVTSNKVGLSVTARKSKGKQLALNSEESDMNVPQTWKKYWLSLKEFANALRSKLEQLPR